MADSQTTLPPERPEAGAAPQVWTEQLRIKSYDVDFRRQATLESLCRYFLEAAWNHAEALGVGFAHLAFQNRFWVLSRLLVECERFPDWGAAVTLRTWPRPAQTVFALRDFEFHDSRGRLAGGSSAWLMLDARSHRPQKVEKLLSDIQTRDTRGASRDPEKLQIHASGQPFEKSPAAPCARPSAELTCCARYSDVDLNRHVNSAHYVRWLLDAYPMDWHETHTPRSLELNFLGECKAGEQLKLVTQARSSLEYFHQLLKSEGAEALQARLAWEA